VKPLDIARADTLARIIGVDVQSLQAIASHIDDYYIEDSTPKKSGELRILHKPRYILKIIQQNIRKMLSGVPLPDCVYGWVKGKSIKSAVEPHCNSKYIYCFDIHSYFDSVHPARVYVLLTKRLKCTPPIARLITILSTYKKGLPQGSPCSPVLANLVLFDFDVSLSFYAAKHGILYSRLGDDIILSSDHKLLEITHIVTSELRRYGLSINPNKTQIGKPQLSGIKVLGVVIGTGISISRQYRRNLRAILHNAQKTGLEAQNRDSRYDFRKHLSGRIAFIEMFNAAEGQKLRKILVDIQN